MNKKLLFLALVAFSTSMVSCGSSPSSQQSTQDCQPASSAESYDPLAQGLEFFLTDDGTYVVSQGTASMLSHITIPEIYNGRAVSAIKDHGFEEANLVSISIPSSITSIGNYAFSNCDSLATIDIPSSVTSIGDSAFSDCDALRTVTLHEGLLKLGGYAFSKGHFRAIEIPSTVTKIGTGLFASCSPLIRVTLPEGLTSLPDSTFANCTSISSIAVPSTVTHIGKMAFRGATSLTNVALPEALATIGEEAFYYCKSLKTIVLPDNVTTIGDSTFENCYALTSVTLPKNLKRLPNKMFASCSRLPSIEIPDGVTTIGNSVFSGCTTLASLTIPDSVTKVGSSVLYGCTGLTSLTIGGVGWGSFFSSSDCPNLETLVFNGAGERIPYNLCRNMVYLKTVTIGSGIKTIESSAFGDCASLETIYIPNTVLTIEPGVFYGCVSLKDIYYDGTKQQWNGVEIGTNAFYGTKAPTIHCTDGDIENFYGVWDIMIDYSDPTRLTNLAKPGDENIGVFKVKITSGDHQVRLRLNGDPLYFHGLDGVALSELYTYFVPPYEDTFIFYVNSDYEVWVESGNMKQVHIYAKMDITDSEAYLVAYAWVWSTDTDGKWYYASHVGESWESKEERHYTSYIPNPVGKGIVLALFSRDSGVTPYIPPTSWDKVVKKSADGKIVDWGTGVGCNLTLAK